MPTKHKEVWRNADGSFAEKPEPAPKTKPKSDEVRLTNSQLYDAVKEAILHLGWIVMTVGSIGAMLHDMLHTNPGMSLAISFITLAALRFFLRALATLVKRLFQQLVVGRLRAETGMDLQINQYA